MTGGYAAFDNIVVTADDVRAGVPEPSTWAMMLSGFALVGGALRRRRRSVMCEA